MNNRKTFVCPTCLVAYQSAVKLVGRSRGNTCPNGHFNSYNQLYRFAKTGTPTKPRERKPARMPKLTSYKHVDVANALRWMIEAHARVLRTLPPGTAARSLVDGAYGRLPDLCTEILASVEAR